MSPSRVALSMLPFSFFCCMATASATNGVLSRLVFVGLCELFFRLNHGPFVWPRIGRALAVENARSAFGLTCEEGRLHQQQQQPFQGLLRSVTLLDDGEGLDEQSPRSSTKAAERKYTHSLYISQKGPIRAHSNELPVVTSLSEYV